MKEWSTKKFHSVEPENSDFTKWPKKKKKQSGKTTHYVIPPVSTFQWGQTTGMGSALVVA